MREINWHSETRTESFIYMTSQCIVLKRNAEDIER
jgi:hypothetical protein